MSETLPSVPKRRSRALLITLAALAGVALTLWYGWKRPVEQLATQAIREALPRDVQVKKVEVSSPTSISLVGVERGRATVEEVRVTFSPVSALREGVASGVERVEIVRPTIRIEPAAPGERLSAPELIERVAHEVRELVAAESAGLSGPSLSGATVVVTDGRLLVGDEEVVTGVRAQFTPGPAGLSAQLSAGFLHFGDVPWALRGEYRPRTTETGRSVHGLRLSGAREGASVSLTGEIGGESELLVEVRGVEAADIGRFLLPVAAAPQVLDLLAALGAADGSIVLRGSLDRPEVRAQLSGKARSELGAGEGVPWRLDVSGGGGAPLDAVLAVDGDAIEVSYAPDARGSLRLSGERLPVALIGRLAGLALGVEVPAEALSGSADIDVSIEGLSVGAPAGSFEARLARFAYGAIAATEGRFAGTVEASEQGGRFEFAGTLAGETAGEIAGSATWAGGEVAGSLDIPWAYFGSFSLSDGELHVTSRADGLAVVGRATAGGGSIELREGFIGEGGFRGEFALEESSAPAVVELLRSLNVAFPGDRTVRGTVSGVVEVTAGPGGAVTVSGRLESDRMGYRDFDFHAFSLAGDWAAESWEIDALVLRWEEAELVVSARGAGDYVEGDGVFTEGPPGVPRARIELSGGGRFSDELRLAGSGVAGDGGIGIDASWRPRAGDYAVAVDLSRFPLSLLTAHALEGEMAGAASGPFFVAGAGGAWRAKADLALSGVSYRGVELRSGRFELDLGSLPEGLDLSGVPAGGGVNGLSGCQGCVYGAGRLDGRVALAGEGAEKPVDVRVEFSGDRGDVSVLPIDVWGGRITGGGALVLTGGEWAFDLHSEGSRLHYGRGGVEGVVDFALRLTGSPSAPALAGRVTVSEGEFDLLRLPSAPSRGGASGKAAGLRFNPSLDVGIEIRPASVTAGTLLAGEMEGAIAVKGSAARPEVFGEVALVRGDFRYLGSRFDAEAGRVRFRGSELPELEVAGKRKVGGVEITASVLGPVDNLKLVLSSDPPLPQNEILELLNVPADVDLSAGWGELARALAQLVNAELASQVYWRLGQALENALGLDRFRIDQGDGALQLTIGKYLIPDLYLSYTQELGGEKSQDIALEYRLGPNATITSQWDFEKKREVGVEVAVPF